MFTIDSSNPFPPTMLRAKSRQGAVKPWSTGVPVWSKIREHRGVAESDGVLSELNKIWQEEFRALRASRCSQNLTATRACLTDR